MSEDVAQIPVDMIQDTSGQGSSWLWILGCIVIIFIICALGGYLAYQNHIAKSVQLNY